MAADCGVNSATGETALAAIEAAMMAGHARDDTLAMLLPLEQAAHMRLFDGS
jgi:hypothetical protein